MQIFLSRFLPCAYVGRDQVWFRLWMNGYGVNIHRTPMLFSEPYGYRKSYAVGFGWRLIFLKWS
jgi:hypothetical protein